ncbi:divisome protein SepX/GlpR [Nocardia sp. NPDC003482]
MPNSILWIGLVVLWVFVLFPMLADRHPRIRRTTDAALATRVLHRGGTKRRMRKGPGAGHETDPDWVPARVQRKLFHGDDAEDRMTTSADEPVTEDETTDGTGDSVEAPAAAAEDTEIIEAEVAEGGDDDSARAADEQVGPPVPARVPATVTAPGEPREVPESDSAPDEFVPVRRGRGGYDPEADAIARATRYRFRQRTALGLVLSMLMFGAFAVVISPMLWSGFLVAGAVLVTYLIYLRRQTRMEEEIRRRRAARLARPRRPAEFDEDYDEPAPRPERPAHPAKESTRTLHRRAVVLDIDDEDPMFDYLEPFDAAAARATRHRAAGGEIRRAAGE